MIRSSLFRRSLFLFLAPVCSVAMAQPAPPTYVCGGVGQADQQAMKAQAGQHSVMLTFAVSNGAYLADVDVQIAGPKGAVVLSARCDGPIMLVDLPAGTWHVTARVNGQSRSKTVIAVAGRNTQATFVWPVENS
jgi:hypothetical protein